MTYVGLCFDRVYLLGLVVAPLFWKKSEWLGLSIVCSISDIYQSLYKSRIWPMLSSGKGEIYVFMFSACIYVEMLKFEIIQFIFVFASHMVKSYVDLVFLQLQSIMFSLLVYLFFFDFIFMIL